MKDNKVCIDLIVPSLKEKYNVFIPVNKTVGEVIVILNKTIHELNDTFPIVSNLSLFNVSENKIYELDEEIINIEIRNGTILALL